MVDNAKTVKGFDSMKSPYAKKVQQLFQGLDSFIANSSHPADVAQVILNAVNSTNSELRYPVGKDADLLFKLRTELSERTGAVGKRKLYGKEGFCASMNFK